MSAGETRDIYSGTGNLRGVWTRGDQPRELVLSDGSCLVLQPAEHGRVLWQRRSGDGQHRSGDGSAPDGDSLSVPQALELAGEEFSGYVTVRTRSEAEWLRTVAEWCADEAARLDEELTERRSES